jgi:hypothetical protein
MEWAPEADGVEVTWPSTLEFGGDDTACLLIVEMAEHYGISDLNGYEPKALSGIYGGPHPAFDIQ